jgi:hypothetical protein
MGTGSSYIWTFGEMNVHSMSVWSVMDWQKKKKKLVVLVVVVVVGGCVCG